MLGSDVVVVNSLLKRAFIPRPFHIARAIPHMSAEYRRRASGSKRASGGREPSEVWQSLPRQGSGPAWAYASPEIAEAGASVGEGELADSFPVAVFKWSYCHARDIWCESGPVSSHDGGCLWFPVLLV